MFKSRLQLFPYYTTYDYKSQSLTCLGLHKQTNFETEYKFESKQPASRHPHYGRFLKLDPNKFVEMTWVTGKGGTEGTETIVAVELTAVEGGSML